MKQPNVWKTRNKSNCMKMWRDEKTETAIFWPFVVQIMKVQFIHSTVIKWFKKFHSGCKNLEDQLKSDKPNTMDSKVVLQTIAVNLASKHLESIRWAWHLTIQCGLSPSYPQQKHQGLSNCTWKLPKYYRTFDSANNI